MGKYGTNLEGFGAFDGGVNADKGAPLVSTSSDGETSLLFGPAALREIQAGVANGDFAIPPDDATATITESNPLPYWSYTDVNSSGAITAAIIADSGVGSGNFLRFTIASGTTTGKSATITRFVPVPSSASRSFSFYAEASFDAATSTTQATALLSCQYYKQDQTTTTGTAFDSGSYTFAYLAGPGLGITAPNLWAVAPDLTLSTAPADAAYLKITITIATVATQSADRTIDLNEVRLAHGLPELILTDKDYPGTNPPAFINAAANGLNIQSGSGDYLALSPDTELTAATTIRIEAGSGDATLVGGTTATLQGGTTVELIAPSGVNVTTNGTTLGVVNTSEVSTTGDLFLNAAGGDVIIRDTSASGTNPRLLFRDADGTYYTGLRAGSANVMEVLSGSTGVTYGQLWAARIYAMDGSTASRYMFDNGTQTAFSGAVLTGTLTSTGTVTATNFTGNSITGTTLNTNAAIWVQTGGTTYNLRRNTSSARYKTNIVDADDAVLEAAKKIRPRHYESTIADEAGATRLGFIAEEVEAAGLTHAVGYNADGRVDTLDPTALIAALFARVNDLEERLKALESR